MKGERYEVIIVGGGIAGASLSYFLAERGMTDILLLEKEDQPGYHATGRSASVLVELDPVRTVLQLKVMAAEFFRAPPPGFCESPLLDPRGVLTVYAEPLWPKAAEIIPFLKASGVAAEALTIREVLCLVPVLAPGTFSGGILLARDGHIEVHELLWSYLRQARRRGLEMRCNTEVKALEVNRGRCCGVVTDRGVIKGRWVVNAAGAWAGVVAEMAGAVPVQFTPRRRTVISFAAPEGIDPSRWPFVENESYHFYFGPESGGLLASPMDEDPVEPGDARPDEFVVAQAIDLVGRLAPTLVPRTLRNCWSGLRTFAPDQAFLIGADPLVGGFFWLAGQGGSGIETSPAAGQIAADLLLAGKTERFDAAALSPARFR